MWISLIALALVFILIAVRQVGRYKLQIWQIMLGGSLLVLVFGEISPADALHSINIDVILFLFGMFILGEALEHSGYLAHISYKFFKRARNRDALLVMVLFSAGIASAFLMNDTVAIIGTPVVLLLSRRHNMHAKVLLLALCFAVTIGSVFSPIGNPQNLLIALNGDMKTPFTEFATYLLLPTLINIFIAYLFLKLYYKEHFRRDTLVHDQEPIKDHRLTIVCKLSLLILILMIALKIFLVTFRTGIDFRLTYIAIAAAAPIILFSPKRKSIIKNIDWSTLVFFASMFVLMASVWNTGFFQETIAKTGLDIKSNTMVFGVSIVVSQLISNVPLVALYLPLLMTAGAERIAQIALAAGSTIAGNLLILGAASNVIIIQNAEKKANETITFWEFARIGIPLTIANVLVYWVFLQLF